MMTQSRKERGAETLREQLARSDAMLEAIVPIMGHLLADEDNSLFSDEIVARVRGVLSHLARQLLTAHALTSGDEGPHDFVESRVVTLLGRLTEQPGLLLHAHALAVEWRTTERLEREQAIDPIVSPLMQAMIESNEAERASLAMQLLAAQVRFRQAQRRMELPLNELPGELLHAVLRIWRQYSDEELDGGGVETDRELRQDYIEGASRYGLLSRLVAEMAQGIRIALSPDHAGVAIFLSALASATGQAREITAITTHEGLSARLALTLRSAGLSPREVERTLLTVHPDMFLPSGVAGRSKDEAADILSGGWSTG